jgi:hypothetical protein
MDNFSRKAKFESVRFEHEAVMFHSMKYELGFRYPLALACYQLHQIIKMKEAKIDEDNVGS